MDAPILELTGIVKTFPGVKALDGAELRVRPGRVMALMGENGAGKSTLMKVITGIYQRDAGEVIYQGKPVHFKGPRESQHAGISIIHQELNLIPELSITENIFLGRELTSRFGRIQWQVMHDEAALILQRLKVEHDPRTPVGQLSIGQQQMVEIAKALSFRSRVIIMDEPTDALTDQETEALFTIINELKADGCGIVYISHRLKEIFEICDDVTVFRDGCFICEKPVSVLDEDTLIEKMVGRKLDEQYPRIEHEFGPVMLKVEHLSNDDLDDISFELHEGEILGISGLMGAGRTELVRALYGAVGIDSGKMTLDGKPLQLKSCKDGLGAGIAYISEDRKGDGLILELPVLQNMSLSSLANYTRQGGFIDGRRELDQVNDFIDRFNIKTPSAAQLIGNLSGGNQQKVAIAKGLLTQPKVLILDEPTRGVDVGAKKEIYQLINEFKRKGMSIILVSSEMPEILGMSDRVLVMHEGRISAEFSADEACQEGLMAAAVGQIEAA